jgi:molybdenum cofactor cytidylyltransferase
MNLKRALRVDAKKCIAFSGSGGKTTALFHLARQLDAPVLVTTTTHLSLSQLALADRILQIDESTVIEELFENLPAEIIFLRGKIEAEQRVTGIPETRLGEVHQFAHRQGIPFLIEADGSRQRPLKAPADHEPAIPSFVDQVVVVAGLSALGQPLNEEWVHRVDLFAELAGMNLGERISTDAIITVLLNPRGGLKGIPAGVRRTILLNQADNMQLQAQGNRIARRTFPYYDSAIVASLGNPTNELRDEHLGRSIGQLPEDWKIYAVHEQIATIILAAGGSDRIGRTKQLLPWRGEPLVRHVARAAIEGGIKKIFVVVGAAGDEIKQVLSDLPVTFVDNFDWQRGQSSSLKAGLAVLPVETGAVIFLLADQPHVSPMLIQALIEKHASTLAPIIAPLVDGQRGNPVLFDRETFRDLQTIQGDSGGRELFSQYPIHWIDWHDAGILQDIDTEEDYQRLLSGDI